MKRFKGVHLLVLAGGVALGVASMLSGSVIDGLNQVVRALASSGLVG